MPKAIRGEKKTPPVMLSHDSPLLVEGAFPPKRNDVLLPRVYLKTPDAPGQRAFSRRAASFFLEIRQYSCEKMSCAARKFLAAGHIGSFQIHPNTKGRGGGPPRPPAGYQPSFRVRNGWTEGTAAGELRVFQSRNEETRMFRAATAPAKNAVRSSPPGGEGPVGTEGPRMPFPDGSSEEEIPKRS